jgi:uncharacterized protein
MTSANAPGVPLPDVNVLVALLWEAHLHHGAAVAWFTSAESFATCSITQTGFVRVSSNPSIFRDALSVREAVATLAALIARPAHRFLPDDVGFVDNAAVAHDRLVGHRQVTDAHLVGLARRHRAQLVTFDAGLAALGGDTVRLLPLDGLLTNRGRPELRLTHVQPAGVREIDVWCGGGGASRSSGGAGRFDATHHARPRIGRSSVTW